MRILACLLVSLPLFVACKASVKANAKVAANSETKDFDEPLEPASGDETSGFGDEGETLDDTALSGARPDLLLAAEQPTPNCQCLAVHLGQPSDPAFLWQGQAPRVNPSTQLVIALSSDGIGCPAAPKDGLGASYWGYEAQGNDIVVFVENARIGRPVTRGAIIPRPPGDGRVLVRPRDRRVPYGAGPTGTGDCPVSTRTGDRAVPLEPRKS